MQVNKDNLKGIPRPLLTTSAAYLFADKLSYSRHQWLWRTRVHVTACRLSCINYLHWWKIIAWSIQFNICCNNSYKWHVLNHKLLMLCVLLLWINIRFYVITYHLFSILLWTTTLFDFLYLFVCQYIWTIHVKPVCIANNYYLDPHFTCGLSTLKYKRRK